MNHLPGGGWSICEPALPEVLTNFPIARSHSRYSDFFQNLHDEFATDVVIMGGPVARPIEISTGFFPHTCSFCCFSPSCNGHNPEKKSRENIISPSRMGYLYQAGQGTIEEAMVDFAADTTLEVRRNTRLDDVVYLVAPGVEVQTDRTWTLPERGHMTSTTGSHRNIKRCRGFHAIDNELLDENPGTKVLQKHPHHPIGSYGARDGGVLLGVSIEDGKQLECSSPHYVSYETGYDFPCVYVQTKSYCDTNAEALDPTATETQGYPSKGAEDEETARMSKL
jgi:hypothetical protein